MNEHDAPTHHAERGPQAEEWYDGTSPQDRNRALAKLCATSISSNQLFQVRFRPLDVLDLLRAGNFPLNRNRAAIVELFQALDDTRKINFALPNGHLFAQLLRIGRIKPILGMEPANVLPEHIQRIHRIAFP